MSGETRFTRELNKLRQMPFFMPRFISLGLLLALNDLSRIFVKSSAVVFLSVLLGLSAVTFLAFQTAVIVQKKQKPLFARTPAVIWGILCLCCLISSVINGFSYNLAVILLIYPFFVICCNEEGFVNLFLLACGIAVFADIGASLIFYPLIDNNLSISLAGLVPVLLCAVAWVLLNTKKFYLSLFSCSVFLCALLIFFSGVSGGRTGFLTIIATLIFFVSALVIKFVSAKKSILYHSSTISTFIIVSAVLLITLTVCGAIVIDSLGTPADTPASIENLGFFSKFIVSLQNGNFLSNRGMIWKYTFENTKFFGNGASFYNAPDVLSPDQCSAHNSYLAILGHYGLFAFVTFLVFCVFMLILSVRYCLASRRLYIFPFTVLVTYYTAGITEDLIFMYSPRVITLLFFLACAYLTVIGGKQPYRLYVEAKR